MSKRMKIKIKRDYKHRAPHKPTRVHKNKKAYDRNKSKRDFRRRIEEEEYNFEEEGLKWYGY